MLLLTGVELGDRIAAMHRSLGVIVFVAFAALAFDAASTEELPGDPALGRALALRECQQCHQVQAGEREGVLPEPPAFQNLADDPAMTALALRVFLHSPHANMPNLILSDADVDDVIAYIHSLKSE